MGSVTYLNLNNRRDVIEALEALLRLAKGGRLKGILLSAKTDLGQSIFITGEYQRNIDLAAKEAAQMYEKIAELKKITASDRH